MGGWQRRESQSGKKDEARLRRIRAYLVPEKHGRGCDRIGEVRSKRAGDGGLLALAACAIVRHAEHHLLRALARAHARHTTCRRRKVVGLCAAAREDGEWERRKAARDGDADARQAKIHAERAHHAARRRGRRRDSSSDQEE